jgi:hypothetical protein
MMPKEAIKRIKTEYIEKYYNPEYAQEFTASES